MMVAQIAEIRPDYVQLLNENALLWEANKQHQERIAELEHDNSYIRNQLDFYRDWRKQADRVPTEVLTSGEKATVAALYGMIRSGEIAPNTDGYYPIEPWRAAEISGQSTGTVRGHINYVSDVHEDGKPEKKAAVPLFDKRLVKIPDELREGEFIEATYLKPLEPLPYPLDYRHVARQLHNIGGAGRGQGRKPKCEQCGRDLQEKEHIIDRQRYTLCPRCHITHVYPVEHINDALPATDDFPPDDGGNQPDFSEADKEDFEAWCESMPPIEQEEAENQPDFEGDTNGENQPDFQHEDADDCNQLDTVISSSLPNQVNCEVAGLETENPSIPPMPLDASQIKAAACDLLLEIAGPGPQHIEMNRGTIPDFSGKYITVDRKPHKGDMSDHIRGVRTKGASLRHPFNNTRALCFDADTSQDWQCLKEAALMLVAAGFKVILEESPAPEGKHAGGGHLWIIFDSYPDAYSARQTVVNIASQLGEVKEYWPHEKGVNCPPNVRLPGGKYVTPNGFQAWCKLYDAYGNELSHDGAGAASVLLEMQTPAVLVKKLEKKTELVLTQEAIAKPAPPTGGILGEKADVLNDVLREFEYSWDDLAALAGGYNKAGYFPAKWRGDKNPNVKEWKGHDLAKDFSTEAWPDCKCMDRHQVWCLLQAGENWREFRRLDLDQRCKAYRLRLEIAL